MEIFDEKQGQNTYAIDLTKLAWDNITKSGAASCAHAHTCPP